MTGNPSNEIQEAEKAERMMMQSLRKAFVESKDLFHHSQQELSALKKHHPKKAIKMDERMESDVEELLHSFITAFRGLIFAVRNIEKAEELEGPKAQTIRKKHHRHTAEEVNVLMRELRVLMRLE